MVSLRVIDNSLSTCCFWLFIRVLLDLNFAEKTNKMDTSVFWQQTFSCETHENENLHSINANEMR